MADSAVARWAFIPLWVAFGLTGWLLGESCITGIALILFVIIWSMLIAVVLILNVLRMPRLAGFGARCMLYSFALILLPSAGLLRGHLDLQRAKRFCENLIEPLDEWYRVNGKYPEHLQDLNVGGNYDPGLVQYNSWSDGQAFSFDVAEPGAFIWPKGFILSSRDRVWRRYD